MVSLCVSLLPTSFGFRLQSGRHCKRHTNSHTATLPLPLLPAATAATARRPRMTKKRVLIVGGGFAGLAAARELNTGAFDITVVDPKRCENPGTAACCRHLRRAPPRPFSSSTRPLHPCPARSFFEHVPNAPACFLSASSAERSLADYPAGQPGVAYRQGVVVGLATDGATGEATLQVRLPCRHGAAFSWGGAGGPGAWRRCS